jgi:hypothetical protein
MNRQKIIFLIVLVAVGLFIASMVASMFASKETLANGYELSVGGKGETWLRTPDRRALITDVTAVWTSADRMLVERHLADDKPPFKDRGCDYQVAEGRGALRPVSEAEARGMLAGMERQTASAKTCVKPG